MYNRRISGTEGVRMYYMDGKHRHILYYIIDQTDH
jgi:hypothetical protein